MDWIGWWEGGEVTVYGICEVEEAVRVEGHGDGLGGGGRRDVSGEGVANGGAERD